MTQVRDRTGLTSARGISSSAVVAGLALAAWSLSAANLLARCSADVPPGVNCQCYPDCVPASGLGFRSLGFWHDRRIAPAIGPAIEPDLDVSSSGEVAVTWAELDPAIGQHVLRLARSLDGGCSWTAETVPTGPGDVRSPEVALSEAATTLVYVQGGNVWALQGGAPVQLSTAFPGTAAHPELVTIDATGFGALHAAWEAEVGGRRQVVYKHDLLDGSGWTGSGGSPDETVLSASFVDGDSVRPVLVADVGGSAPTFAGVGVAFVHEDGGGSSSLYHLRSTDGGDTFFGDVADPASAGIPTRVDEAGPPTPAAATLAMDSTASLYTDRGNTDILLWQDGRDGGADVRADAQYTVGNELRLPWADPDAVIDVDAAVSRDPALIAVPAYWALRQRNPGWLGFWTDDRSGNDELWFAMGHASAVVNTDCVEGPLTGLYPAPRSGGAAGMATADEAVLDAFVAWSDSRSGMPEIFFKRTDDIVDPADLVSAEANACPEPAAVTLAWQEVPGCEVLAYAIEWDSDAGFGSPGIKIVDAPAGTGAVGLADGLVAGMGYHFRIVIVDEACNARISSVIGPIAAVDCGCTDPPEIDASSLRVARSGADVVIAFDDSLVPAQADHFNAYRGGIAPPFDFSDHAPLPPPNGCALSGSPTADAGAAGDGSAAYYLVVAACDPASGPDVEGPYGQRSDGRRDPSPAPCP